MERIIVFIRLLYYEINPKLRLQVYMDCTFSRRFALKMDLKPNCMYNRSKGMRHIMSLC